MHLQRRPQKAWYNWCSNTQPNWVWSTIKIKHDTCPSTSNLGNILGEGKEAITTTTMVLRQASN